MSVKSLEALNQEFMREEFSGRSGGETPSPAAPIPTEQRPTEPSPESRPARKKKRKRGALTVISDILFCLAILVVLASILAHLYGVSPKLDVGYSYYTVLTGSMQDEIPRGSLILIRRTDPLKLKEGDNITYTRGQGDAVTHKIVSVYENYQDSGARGFQTKGVNNGSADREIVPEENVIGRVILTVPAAGAAMAYLGENIHIVFIVFGFCAALYFVIRVLSGKADKLRVNDFYPFGCSE